MIQHSCSRIRTVPRLSGSRLAANNAGYFVVTSSLEASPKATQLPDSAHSSDGFLMAGISRQHPPSLPVAPVNDTSNLGTHPACHDDPSAWRARWCLFARLPATAPV